LKDRERQGGDRAREKGWGGGSEVTGGG